jgi:tetratricopeptide (TPR) repeat protein
MQLLFCFATLMLLFTNASVSAAEELPAPSVKVREQIQHVAPHSGLVVVSSTGGLVSITTGTEEEYFFPIEGIQTEWAYLEDSARHFSITGKQAAQEISYELTFIPYSPRATQDPVLQAARAAALDRRDPRTRSDAIAMYENSLQNWPEGSLEILRFHSILRLAELYRQSSAYEPAYKLLDHSLATATAEQASILWFTRGMISYQEDQVSTAQQAFCAALAAMLGPLGDCSLVSLNNLDIPGSFWMASTANFLGLLLHNQGRLLEAASWYRLAESQLPAQYAMKRHQIRNNQCGLSYDRGEYRSSLACLEEIQALAEASFDTHSLASALGNIATVHLWVGEHDAAIKALLKELDIEQAEGNLAGIVQAEHRLGLVHLELGDLSTAETHLRYSLDNRVRNKLRGEDEARLSLGLVCRQAGRYEEANDLFVKAEQSFKANGQVPGQFHAILETALNEMQQGDYTSAELTLQKATKLSSSIADKRLLGRYFEISGSNALQRGELADSENLLSHAMSLHRETEDTPGKVSTLYHFSSLSLARHQPDAALGYLQQAADELEGARLSVSNPRLRATFSGSFLDVYGAQIDLLMDTGRMTDAAELALNNRTRLLMDSMRRRTVISTSAHTGAVRSMAEINRTLNAKLAARRTASRRWQDPEVLSSLDGEIGVLRARLTAIEAEIYTGHIQTSKQVRIEELQKDLEPEELLVLQWVGSQRSWIWQISSDRVSAFEAPPLQGMELQISGYLHRIWESDRLPVSELADLTDLVLGDIPNDVTRLFVMPHDVLSLVPYNALYSRRRGSQLISFVEVLVLSLPRLARSVSIEQSAHPSALLVGDPRILNPDQQLPTLTSSRGEVLDASRQLQAKGFLSVTLLEHEATKLNLLNELKRRPTVLHLATHGLAGGNPTSATGLMFSDTDKSGEAVASFLSLGEIYQLEPGAKLVVLSACDTGRGERIRGEGPLSLARGFIAGGAQVVIASLWQVKDSATRTLMRYFYEYWDGTTSAASALNRAQLEMSRQSRWRGVVNWGGFIALAG